MGFSVVLWGAEKPVPAEYWCPYGTWIHRAFNSFQIWGVIYASHNLVRC